MSHSVRHTPILGFGKSDKRDKVATHRKLRRKVHAVEGDTTVETYPETREVSNTRRWRKSPRGYHADTAKAVPKLMRK